MDTSVKTRQTGAIPKSFGRQIGVLPVASSGQLRRGNGDGNIPVGGTDIDSLSSYQTRPLSGNGSSKSLTSATNKSGSRRPYKVGEQASHDTNDSSILQDRRYSASKTKTAGSKMNSSKPLNTTLKKSPGSSSSIHSDYVADIKEPHPPLSQPSSSRVPSSVLSSRSDSSKRSPGSSKLTSQEPLRKPPTSSAVNKRSSKGTRARPSSGTKRSEPNDSEDASLAVDDPEGQDIKFYDIPSQRSRSGSKMKRSPGSAECRPDTGRKPPKTIDPEEIVAQNMESDLYKIYEIGLHASEITYIDNLEKFRKLRVLDLSCNFIEQIQNLEFCKDLRELKLYDNRLRRIECLENLKELSSLQLQHNRIKNIGKGLAGLKKLKTLRIDCNQLLKIETPELSQCVQLTSLDISYNMLDSLAALNYLPNLEEVNASGNRLKSVSDLSKCKLLQEIDLSWNRLTDLSGLRGLPKLLTLNVSNNQLSSLKSMGRLKSLQDLLASGNHIHELSTIPTQLPVLEVLDLTNNEITDWDEFYNLDQMTELVELFISGNPFCAQDGTMPHYFSAIQAVLPDLEIIDGAHIKKHVSKGAPLMRPMSASTIVSLRQMDTQMRTADEQMKTLEKSLEEKFASLRATCDSLPLEPPKSSRLSTADSAADDTPISSRCSSRNRILQAKKFAESVNRK